MKIINDYKQFKDIYSQAKEKLGRLNSNCLLPSRTLPEAISNGNVFYNEYQSGFIIFTTEDAPFGFYKAYYFLSDMDNFPLIKTNKPVLLEELDSNGKREVYLRQFQPKLNAGGFKMYAENYLFEIDLDESILRNCDTYMEKLHTHNLCFKTDSTINYSEDVRELWKQYLKPTDVPESHMLFSKNGVHLICVLTKENEICGVNWWHCSNSVCEIRHTVTRPDHYREGIGTFMILSALEYAYHDGCKSAFTFIDAENIKSIRMYEKIGFRKSGKISRQFVKPA